MYHLATKHSEQLKSWQSCRLQLLVASMVQVTRSQRRQKVDFDASVDEPFKTMGQQDDGSLISVIGLSWTTGK